MKQKSELVSTFMPLLAVDQSLAVLKTVAKCLNDFSFKEENSWKEHSTKQTKTTQKPSARASKKKRIEHLKYHNLPKRYITFKKICSSW